MFKKMTLKYFSLLKVDSSLSVCSKKICNYSKFGFGKENGFIYTSNGL